MGNVCARFGIDSNYSFLFSLSILITSTELFRQFKTAILESATEMGQNHSNANYIVVFVRVVTLEKRPKIWNWSKVSPIFSYMLLAHKKTSPAWYKSPILYSISEFLGNGLTEILWVWHVHCAFIHCCKKTYQTFDTFYFGFYGIPMV